jgi:uncharacterized OB-fold protein
MTTYLPAGLPQPIVENDKLDEPYWAGTRTGILLVQRCGSCHTWQWGPEWICHHCRSWDVRWVEVEGSGTIWSWTRCWYPAHPALTDRVPYVAVLVELPHAGNIRMLGNLLGDALDRVPIGTPVEAVFEAHNDAPQPFTLVQWKRREGKPLFTAEAS